MTARETAPFMLRVAGLPVGVLDGLASPRSSEWAARVLTEQERLGALGAELSDLLHGLVGGNQDERSRRQILRLRRALFSNALPPDAEHACAAVTAMDAEAGTAVAGWLADRARWEGLLASGAEVLAGEIAAGRGRLRGLLEEPRLRLALPVASPALADRLDQTDPARALAGSDKRARKLERSALAYLYRTASKTSPFSTFTGVVPGEFADGAPQELGVADQWSSHARLNVVVVSRLAELVAADERRRGDLPVALTPGWRPDAARIRYVRRWVTTGDDSAPVSFDSVRDQLFFLRRSGVLDRLIEMFAERPGPRCADVVTWLAQREGADPAECERYLSTMLELGLLQIPSLQTDVHTPEPLRGLAAALRALDRPWAAELADRLADPIACLDRYPAAGSADRGALLRQLRAGLRDTARWLGAEDFPLPQTLLYEDASAGPGPVQVDSRVWTETLAPALRAVERILPAFDPILPHRLTFAGFFAARFGRGGRCPDVLGLVEDFHEDFYDQYASYTADRRPFDPAGRYVPEENWLGLASITAVDEARQCFADHVRARWHGWDGSDELWLDDDVIDKVADLLAPAARPVIAQSHFLQLATGESGGSADTPVAVLNQSYGGLAFPFSRFTHCFAGEGDADSWLIERLRAGARAVQPPGAVLAEVTGGAATTNLNLHDRLVDYEIVCPGERSCAPADRQLPLADLSVEHDPVTDRLRLCSARLGREVVPVYFGYLIPAALPAVARTLLLLAPSVMGRLEVWAGVPEGEAVDGVTARPRVRYRGLVLARAGWRVPAPDLPLRRAGAADHEWFLGWQRWRARHRLPRRVFATVHSGQPAGEQAARTPKPQYVDFDSYLSLTALEGIVGAGAQVVLREMLPRPDQLHVRSARGEHVAELAVQTDRRYP